MSGKKRDIAEKKKMTGNYHQQTTTTHQQQHHLDAANVDIYDSASIGN